VTRAERLKILGPDTVARIHTRVDEAPDPSPEVVAHLRRIMTRPAGQHSRPALVAEAA
jgi:hypothetical protein